MPILRTLLTAVALCAAREAPAQLAPAHDSLVIASRILRERRHINVHTPQTYGEAGRRFPVLYMPDGGMDEDFSHVVRAVDSLIATGTIPPTIVVGIPNTERRRDLTGPTRIKSDSAIAPHVGGSNEFRAFIRDELIPTIDARYRTTKQRAIIGESLAGLFIVETFLRAPDLFDRSAAFDPSLWWNHGSLVDSTALLAARTRNARPRKLFVASSRDGIDERSARFADSVRHRSSPALDSRFELHPELTHGTIFAALQVQALVFILK